MADSDHTKSLSEFLGLDEEFIQRMIERGVIR